MIYIGMFWVFAFILLVFSELPISVILVSDLIGGNPLSLFYQIFLLLIFIPPPPPTTVIPITCNLYLL